MRRVFSIALLALALAGGCGKSGEPEGGTDKGAPRDFSVRADTNGQTVVTLNDAAQKRIGLQVAPVAAGEWAAEITAFGTVLDPAPLLALHGELAADEAALNAAAKVAERARALFAEEENVSRKSVEAAEADEKGARIKVETARQSLRLEWGEAIAGLGAAERGRLVERLAAGRTALARVDLTAGDSISRLPPEASLAPVGQEHWTAAKPIGFATRVDPKTLGEGVVMQVEDPGAGMAPGAAVKARLPSGAAAVRGSAVAEGAVLHFQGRTWVYVASAGTNFTRREVALERLLPGGWLTTNGPAPGENIVTVGAAILLSEEQKSQTAAGAD